VDTKPALPVVSSVSRIPLGPSCSSSILHLASKLKTDNTDALALLIGDGWRSNILALNTVLTVEVHHGKGFAYRQGKAIPIGNMTDTLEFLHNHKADDTEEFYGGWIGALSYEALHQVENITSPATDLFGAPQLSFQLPDSYICQDSVSGSLELLLLDTNYSVESIPRRRQSWLSYCDTNTVPEDNATGTGRLFNALKPLLSRQQYIERVRRIREHIVAGDIYQANFTYPVAASTNSEVSGDEILSQLIQESGCHYGAWLKHGNREIVSLSPESFLEKHGDQLWTRPIKGTCARHNDYTADQHAKQQLTISSKNRAELSMIVDLERNDLGRVCAPGTVQVSNHAQLLQLPALYHLFTEVTGTLTAPVTELLPALFPGGSITGAPKIRAMQIISEMEGHQRGVYTGAIGWIGLNGDLEFNIAIRTLQRFQEQWYLSTGGGIVYDSDPEDEYRETLHKLHSFSGLPLPENL
jgi:anthranilate/para-aminobenzoate synthase component I